MKPKKRQKLCHNCEGEIDLDVIVCPFCAADLREEKPEQGRSLPPSNVKRLSQEKQTSQSLYPSPMSIKSAGEGVVESEPSSLAQNSPTVEKPRHLFSATALFTLGVQIFLLGLLMLLFSHKGVVTLRWNAAHWFFYCLGAVPFLYFGYRSLDKL
ncbi:MAG: hypothetical protein HY861_05270 [Chlamydiia bacterium]|nr:hypothetical protein [Chlamydiia bacterium]